MLKRLRIKGFKSFALAGALARLASSFAALPALVNEGADFGWRHACHLVLSHQVFAFDGVLLAAGFAVLKNVGRFGTPDLLPTCEQLGVVDHPLPQE